jgi:hypothetical protein
MSAGRKRILPMARQCSVGTMPTAADQDPRLPGIRKTRPHSVELAGRGCTVNPSEGEAPMPDKSPRKPSAKKLPDRSLKEKRQDKKEKKDGHTSFGGLSGRG